MPDKEKSNFEYENLVDEIGCTLRQKNDEILSLTEEINSLKEKLKKAVSEMPDDEE